MKAAALLACVALLAGCFGYNSGAKKWAYVGDSILIVGGGAAIAAGETESNPKCTATDGVCEYHPTINGALVAGAVLVAAGLVGIIYNITRSEVKTSR